MRHCRVTCLTLTMPRTSRPTEVLPPWRQTHPLFRLMTRLRFGLLLAPAFLLAACVDSPVVPAASGNSAALNSASASGYVIAFKTDKIPLTFATRIAALGG